MLNASGMKDNARRKMRSRLKLQSGWNMRYEEATGEEFSYSIDRQAGNDAVAFCAPPAVIADGMSAKTPARETQVGLAVSQMLQK